MKIYYEIIRIPDMYSDRVFEWKSCGNVAQWLRDKFINYIYVPWYYKWNGLSPFRKGDTLWFGSKKYFSKIWLKILFILKVDRKGQKITLKVYSLLFYLREEGRRFWIGWTASAWNWIDCERYCITFWFWCLQIYIFLVIFFFSQ